MLRRLTQDPLHFAPIIKCNAYSVMLKTLYSHWDIKGWDDELIKRARVAAEHQLGSQVLGKNWVDFAPWAWDYVPAWLPGAGWKRRGIEWRQEAHELYEELWNSVKQSGDKSLVSIFQEKEMHQMSEEEGQTVASTLLVRIPPYSFLTLVLTLAMTTGWRHRDAVRNHVCHDHRKSALPRGVQEGASGDRRRHWT